MAAFNGDDNRSTASTTSRVSFFGMNRCPRTEKLRATRSELSQEMDRCRHLFDAVLATTEGTNDYEEASLDSDSARDNLRDCVYDYIAFARQMAIEEMPGNPLMYAASSLHRIRREWDATRFFDRETYREEFPTHADVVNAREGDYGQRKRNVHRFSWNSIPAESARDNAGIPSTRMRTSSPVPESSEYLGLPPVRHGAQSPGGHLLPPRDPNEYVERYISEIETVNPDGQMQRDADLEDLDEAATLAKRNLAEGLTPR